MVLAHDGDECDTDTAGVGAPSLRQASIEVGSGRTFNDLLCGEVAKVALAWLERQLLGDHPPSTFSSAQVAGAESAPGGRC